MYKIVSSFLKQILVLIEIFLFLRLGLKFLGANSQTFVVKYLYQFTNIIVWPFKGIFPNLWFKEKFIESVTLSAIIGYALFIFIFLKLLKLLMMKK